jgi:SOS-response transcriptional repressor LexA
VDSTGCAAAEPFALRVLGDMMEPEFEHGCVIVVDPEGLVKDGCFVVANHNDEYFFRQLVIDGDRYLLKCLNDSYDEVIEIAGLSAIHGVVSQKAGTRRKDRKRYDC